MKKVKPRNSIEAGKKLIQSLFSTVSVGILLIIINMMFSPQFFWAKFPLFFMSIGLLINLFTFLGFKASEKYEKRELQKEIDREEELELRELESIKKNNETTWDERDFV